MGRRRLRTSSDRFDHRGVTRSNRGGDIRNSAEIDIRTFPPGGTSCSAPRHLRRHRGATLEALSVASSPVEDRHEAESLPEVVVPCAHRRARSSERRGHRACGIASSGPAPASQGCKVQRLAASPGASRHRLRQLKPCSVQRRVRTSATRTARESPRRRRIHEGREPTRRRRSRSLIFE